MQAILDSAALPSKSTFSLTTATQPSSLTGASEYCALPAAECAARCTHATVPKKPPPAVSGLEVLANAVTAVVGEKDSPSPQLDSNLSPWHAISQESPSTLPNTAGGDKNFVTYLSTSCVGPVYPSLVPS